MLKMRRNFLFGILLFVATAIIFLVAWQVGYRKAIGDAKSLILFGSLLPLVLMVCSYTTVFVLRRRKISVRYIRPLVIIFGLCVVFQLGTQFHFVNSPKASLSWFNELSNRGWYFGQTQITNEDKTVKHQSLGVNDNQSNQYIEGELIYAKIENENITESSEATSVGIGVIGGISANRENYTGSQKNGKRHGFGRYVWKDGTIYEGYYEKGQRHDEGTVTAPKYRFIGNFKKGHFEGYGEYYWTDGARYFGLFQEGKRHGEGSLYYSDGSRYIGAFYQGKQHGLGTYTGSDGSRFVGEYHLGFRWNGKSFRADGEIKSYYSNGVIVQS